MPIYEYLCSHCHHQFEIIQKIADEPVTHCEHCGKNSVTRLVSAAGFQLKGTGWYETDFKHKSSKPASESSGADSTEARTETSKEVKSGVSKESTVQSEKKEAAQPVKQTTGESK